MTMLMALSAILASSVAQAMLKQGMNNVGGILGSGNQFLISIQKLITDPFILGGMFLIIITIPLWLEVLARLPLTIAYPLVSIGYVFSLAIGALVLKENVTPLRIAGVAIIIVGVYVLSRSS